MLERQGSESKAQKLLPLSSSPRFSWIEWKAYLFIFAATIVLGKEALTTSFVGVVESAAVKVSKVDKIRCGKRFDCYGHLSISNAVR